MEWLIRCFSSRAQCLRAAPFVTDLGFPVIVWLIESWLIDGIGLMQLSNRMLSIGVTVDMMVSLNG